MIVERIGELVAAVGEAARVPEAKPYRRRRGLHRNLWPHPQEFIKAGRVEVDNNQVENSIRPKAIDKKNWLFIGDAGAGQTSAILFTLIEA